jgi:hypothetical protein
MIIGERNIANKHVIESFERDFQKVLDLYFPKYGI